jgi:hypothetical protein
MFFSKNHLLIQPAYRRVDSRITLQRLTWTNLGED